MDDELSRELYQPGESVQYMMNHYFSWNHCDTLKRSSVFCMHHDECSRISDNWRWGVYLETHDLNVVLFLFSRFSRVWCFSVSA